MGMCFRQKKKEEITDAYETLAGAYESFNSIIYEK